MNLTTDINAMIDIKLMGYWEDTDDHVFEEVREKIRSSKIKSLSLNFEYLQCSIFQVGTIAERTANDGLYEFDPRTLARTTMIFNSWRRFSFGLVRISIADTDETTG